ncbi:MAG TPA: SDR family NAD(P)-dependent oxidoreductase [Trebonia sp.]|nr:SDR family NAD(P)-dependent oxidoreductase [Trebonia sp.]
MKLPAQQQRLPRQDHGEDSYRGSGRLAGKAAVITGAHRGIGRAVAIAYAREGADVLIAYCDEHKDAQETAAWVKQAGRKAVLVPGDLGSAAHCRSVIDAAVVEFGHLDVLVSNGWVEGDPAMANSLSALGHLTRAALPHMPPGSVIIGTALGRPGQLAEVAPAYVQLACDEASPGHVRLAGDEGGPVAATSGADSRPATPGATS